MKKFIDATIDIKLLTAEETLMAEMSTPKVDDNLGWDDLL